MVCISSAQQQVFTAILTLLLAVGANAAGVALPPRGNSLGRPENAATHITDRLLITLHKPLEHHQLVLPDGLLVKEIVDNSHDGTNDAAAVENLAAGGSHPEAEDHLFVVQVTNGKTAEEVLEEVRAMPEVKHAELDAVMWPDAAPKNSPTKNPNDAYYVCTETKCGSPDAIAPGLLWGHRRIASAKAWKVTTGRRSAGTKPVKVGIIDTGIALDHQDLKANTAKHCQDFYNNDGSCDEGRIGGDSHGHGTHVAGIIGAMGNNGLGVVGVNWKANLIGCTMFSDDPNVSLAGSGSTLAAIKCLNWLRLKQGVRIINASFGCSSHNNPHCYSKAFLRAIQAFHKQGGLLVTSAGNVDAYGGTPANNDIAPYYPASYKSPAVMAVAATSATHNGDFWTKSNSEYFPGWSQYGAHSVHIAAPGADIISTYSPASSICGGDQACYAQLSGTSQAAPFVTGAAALIASIKGSPRGAALKKLLMSTADKKSWLKGKVASQGRLNVFNAVYAVKKAQQKRGRRLFEAVPVSSLWEEEEIDTGDAGEAAAVKSSLIGSATRSIKLRGL